MTFVTFYRTRVSIPIIITFTIYLIESMVHEVSDGHSKLLPYNRRHLRRCE